MSLEYLLYVYANYVIADSLVKFFMDYFPIPKTVHVNTFFEKSHSHQLLFLKKLIDFENLTIKY